MKYKVGDAIVIKMKDKYDNEMESANKEDLVGYIEEMACYGGKTLHISEIDSGKNEYRVEECKYSFTDDMIECLASEQINITIPEGYEIDEKNSTFYCIKFKPKPKPCPIIETWNDLIGTTKCKGVYLDSNSIFHSRCDTS
jgi:hypothetical protein